MVFQNYALYPHMSIRENLAFGLRFAEGPKSGHRSAVDDAAAILDLGGLLDRKPKQLSGGQRQRVAVGRAIVREPTVFLMDEPLSNLDASLRVQTRAELTRLYRRLGTTTVYVTHDQVEAMTMGTRIAVMNAGQLQQVGTPKDLYEAPVSRFVAGFIGSPAMNFVDLTVAESTAALILEAPGVRIPIPERSRWSVGLTAGQHVVAGIRPEHLEIGDPGQTTRALMAWQTSWSTSETMSSSTLGSMDVICWPSSQQSIEFGRAIASDCERCTRRCTCLILRPARLLSVRQKTSSGKQASRLHALRAQRPTGERNLIGGPPAVSRSARRAPASSA